MNVSAALELATEEFKKTDLTNISPKSGAVLIPEGIQIDYLSRRYSIRLPDVEWKEEASPQEKLVILHYLLNSKGTLPSDNPIDFREIPGGNLYYPVFEARVHHPFLKYFGENPALLLKASLPLKGKKGGFGDSSVNIPVFPHISTVFIIYQGDEEFPPATKVLFDSNISDYLSAEDIVAVCEDVVRKLNLTAKAKGDSPPESKRGLSP